ncbi:hypothetical protein FC80_GL001320 [Liquorilactobacillus cacaonum DSM 21116]|uniref:PDZ domain-containing protein n=2 Tax=Liquorilactobacillus cacaonum TaxID=483012 RepID=A0A0R2CGR3_9LACO|nr:hypothetical protein FC80_GL001320 [Liquorilactobacillus cacaonum DSM 21116]
MKFLALLIFNPVVWFGLLMTFLGYLRRIRDERKDFRIAVNKDFFEGRFYIKYALGLSIVGSILSLLLGLKFTQQWIFVYIGIVIVGLILSVYVDANSLLLLTFMGVTFLTYYVKLFRNLIISNAFDKVLPSSIFGILIIFYLAKLWMLKEMHDGTFHPKVYVGKRGRRLIRYSLKNQSIIPLVVLIPGDFFHSYLSFWPIMSIGSHSFSLFVLPLWVSWTLKFWRNTAKEELQVSKFNVQIELLIAIIGAAFSVYLPLISLFLFIVLLLFVALRFIQRYVKMKRKGNWYVETHDGVRVVAIQPETPAAKMGLEMGDVIVTCNGLAVTTEAEFYKALQKNSAYCKLRVKTYEGQLKLAESAIFANSPHEIGVILFH